MPELPPDVLELIWFWVRVSLRPRMKRYGPLLKCLRCAAATKIAGRYGIWLFHASRFTTHDSISPSTSVACAWAMFALPKMKIADLHTYVDDSGRTNTTMIIEEDDTENAQAWFPCHCRALWSRIPEPVISHVGERSVTRFVFGPPL
jgi:hypothetical protein